MKKAEGCFPRPCFSILYAQFFPTLMVFVPPEPELPELPLLFPLFCFGLMVVPPEEEFEPDFLGVVIE